jgi:rhoptry neck protein 2
MRNIKRWTICAFLFFICFLILRFLNGKKSVEGYGGHGSMGHGSMGHGSMGHGSMGHGSMGHGGHRGYGRRGGYYRGWGGYGGGDLNITPLYIYDDYDYYYPQPYWYRYIPFYNYYY